MRQKILRSFYILGFQEPALALVQKCKWTFLRMKWRLRLLHNFLLTLFRFKSTVEWIFSFNSLANTGWVCASRERERERERTRVPRIILYVTYIFWKFDLHIENHKCCGVHNVVEHTEGREWNISCSIMSSHYHLVPL